MATYKNYSISSLPTGNLKKSYLQYQIQNDSITDTVLTDVLISGANFQVLFNSSLTAGDITNLNTIVANHYPSSDPYPIYTQEYYVKITESDAMANIISSSIIANNSTITMSVLGASNTDQKYGVSVADPLTLSRLTLTSDLTVNTIKGINGTDVNITNYLQYANRGIILKDVIVNSYATAVAGPVIFMNSSLVNNGMVFNGSDKITVFNKGFYNIDAQISYTDANNSGARDMYLFRNTDAIAFFGSRGTGGGDIGSMILSKVDYVLTPPVFYQVKIATTGATITINATDAGVYQPNFFNVIYMGN